MYVSNKDINIIYIYVNKLSPIFLILSKTNNVLYTERNNSQYKYTSSLHKIGIMELPHFLKASCNKIISTFLFIHHIYL